MVPPVRVSTRKITLFLCLCFSSALFADRIFMPPPAYQLNLPPFASYAAKKKLTKSSLTKKTQLFKNKIEPFGSQEFRALFSRQYNDLELSDKKISLSLRSIHIRDAIKFISKSIGVTFVVDSDVSGVIRPVNFTDAPAGFVLRHILQNHTPKLVLIRDCGVFRITRAEREK